MEETFSKGQLIIVHQSIGNKNHGKHQLNYIKEVKDGNITLTQPLKFDLTTDGINAAQVLVLKQYTKIEVKPNVILNAKPWNGKTGGILAFFSKGTVIIQGIISTRNKQVKLLKKPVI